VADEATSGATRNEISPRGTSPSLYLDPSSENLGWAIVSIKPKLVRHESGCWHPSKAKLALHRYDQQAEFIVRLIRNWRPRDETALGVDESAFPPIERAYIEIPDGGERFFLNSRGQRQQMTGENERKYAQAVGVAQAACHLAGAQVTRVKVSEWKKNAKKAWTMLQVNNEFRLTGEDVITNENESDALGMAIAHEAAVRYLSRFGTEGGDRCDCDLRARQWNPNTGECQTCGMKFRP
jgi:Holliday junction resolvasome RuvABC endonuclease subunit